MENTAIITLSRQGALRRQMSIVANNLANMNTTAYKGENVMFVEHIVKSEGGNSFIPTKLSFVRDVAQLRDTQEGPVKPTGNPLDLAIQDEGYFVVETDNGERYTRNGRFQLDEGGQLVTQHGHPVLSDANAPIFFSPEDRNITITSDGTVATENGALGKLRIVTFENQQQLENQAGGLLRTNADAQEVERPKVQQGALEGSNVNPILEMSKMIRIHRSFNSAKDFIQREDQRQRKMMDQLVARV